MIRVFFADDTHEDRDPESRASVADPNAGQGFGTTTLERFRAVRWAWVPRGEVWEKARLESVDEQIERLTRERDEARREWRAWKEIAEKSTGEIVERGRTVLRLQSRLARLKAAIARWAGEKVRADAAEKRLADLRAWAERESRAASMLAETTPEGHLVSRSTREERAKVYERVVARIDGKEGA